MSQQRKKEEDISNMFQKLDKTTLLQETRYFSTPVSTKKCTYILTRILYLLNQGEVLTTQEATNMFFATTKLFQSNNIALRRLVYLCIKELSTSAEDVIIVTSSLTKDMTGKEDMYRPAAIRTFCSIADATMLQTVERYLKQAIIDKNPAVSSAALVSTLHLSATDPDLAKRFVNEAQEAIATDNLMVSYHALAVVAAARSNDRLATVKFMSKLIHSPHKSPFMICLLIRHAAKLAEADKSDTTKHYIQFIESYLRHKSELVVYEAANAIIHLRHSTKDLAQAVIALQFFCTSAEAPVRLAGIRTLATLTEKHPNAVAACTATFEMLISDSNRSVATLAVITLLSTGNESSMDRLLKQITSFMSDISDEFKVYIVKALRKVCQKYPKKYLTLSGFLVGMLRNEGGMQFKSEIVDVIIELVEENPSAKDVGLAHLCEFIEDCDYVPLAIRVLNVLGREGPKSRQPSRYIRYIYNRMILECGAVRAVAVTTLARFGATCPDLLQNIRVLLARCQLDDEDEIRDRAVFYNAVLETGNEQLINDYIINVKVYDPIALEQRLREHLAVSPDESFDFSSVPLEEVKKKETKVEPKPSSSSLEDQYTEQLKVIPGIDRIGSIFKTCEPVDLTEPETEYRVRCIKHVFARHLVLQFQCLNTLNDQLLEEVHIRLEPIVGYTLIGEFSCKELPYDKPGDVFCVLKFPHNPFESLGSFGATLEFVVRDCDPKTGIPDPGDGYADTYALEEVPITGADQFRSKAGHNDWEECWALAATAAEASDTFALPQTDVAEAAKAVCKHLGLPKKAVVGDTIKEVRGGGMWRKGIPMLVRAKLALAQGVVTMQIAVRSPRQDIATFVLATVG